MSQVTIEMEKVVEKWNTSMMQLGHHCVVIVIPFDISPIMLECMPGEITNHGDEEEDAPFQVSCM